MMAAPLPSIGAAELGRKLSTRQPVILLDVREPSELSLARIDDHRLAVVPLSRLASEGTKALPPQASSPDTEILVLCHHGNRSAAVTEWLIRNGWSRVFNVSGGIDAYARETDPRVGLY